VVVGALGGLVVGVIVGIAVPDGAIPAGVLPVLGVGVGGWLGFYRRRTSG
jgi:hypothetical protein